MKKHVKGNVSWVGYIDWELETFHGDEYSINNGSSQNAYLIEEEKIHQKVLDSFMEIYQENKDKTTKLYAGIEDMLETLDLSGYRMAILSNKPHYHLVPICKKYFSYPFAFVYGQREGIPKKPDKISLLSIIDEMGLKKEEVIYVYHKCRGRQSLGRWRAIRI